MLNIVESSMRSVKSKICWKLASGFCGPSEESAGRHFKNKGFPVAGALADKFDVKTPGRRCP